MFADTMLRVDNKWYLYYGSGDMYVGLATARADFGVGAAEYSLDGTVLTASTYALNKKYGDDRTAWDIDMVAKVYDTNGNLLKTVSVPYTVEHFSHLPEGVYSNGQLVSVEIDLSQIENLPQEYYVETYLADGTTAEMLNRASYYTVVNGIVEHVAE